MWRQLNATMKKGERAAGGGGRACCSRCIVAVLHASCFFVFPCCIFPRALAPSSNLPIGLSVRGTQS